MKTDDIWFLFANQWTFALALASAYYASVRFFGNHLAVEKKDDLTLWLIGSYEASWAQQFGDFFDEIFGKKWLSFRRFFVSGTLSIISVVLISQIFYISGIYDNRITNQPTLSELLVIGLVINVIADYISLTETRWLLSFFDRNRGLWFQLIGLAVDLVLSAAIIFTAITAYNFMRGASYISFSELVATFSGYSVFFYSTFLTSVWAWLYCATTWFMKLFCRTPIVDWLGVEEDPISQIALMGSILVFAISLTFGSLLLPRNEDRLSWFDNLLCENFSAEICEHTARITDNELEKITRLEKACDRQLLSGCRKAAALLIKNDPHRALKILERLCKSGSLNSCLVVNQFDPNRLASIAEKKENGLSISRVMPVCQGRDITGCHGTGDLNFLSAKTNGHNMQAVDFLQIVERNEAKCERGNLNGCLEIGKLYGGGTSEFVDKVGALQRYEAACQQEDLNFCYLAGIFHHIGIGTVKDTRKALGYFEPACDVGQLGSCLIAGVYHKNGEGTEIDKIKGVTLIRKACARGFALACVHEAIAHYKGEGTKVNIDQAIKLFETACDASIPSGCLWVGSIFESGQSTIPVDKKRAMAAFLKGCNGGAPLSCAYAATLYKNAELVTADDKNVLVLYELGCAGGVGFSCLQSGIMHRLGKGTQVNNAIALSRIEVACENQNMEGCHIAGQFYQFGYGTSADISRAREYYQLACINGVIAACNAADQLQK